VDKKTVFVIVEGPSDSQALGVIFTRIFKGENVHIHIEYGDVTSEINGIPNKNIVTNITAIIKKYLNVYGQQKSDIKEIIHITDTDGAYISDDSVIEEITLNRKTVYSPIAIHTSNKQNICMRNRRKLSNLNCLCGKEKIWGIKYRIFYMSCNLDHVLFNKLNISDEEKSNESYNFSLKYLNKIPEFLEFISCSDFSVIDSYNDSWEFIKRDLHSLERHSNLGLCFSEFLEKQKSDTAL
jgi:hypothetical protein